MRVGKINLTFLDQSEGYLYLAITIKLDHEINIPTMYIHISDNNGHTEDETTCLIIYTGGYLRLAPKLFTAGAIPVYGWRNQLKFN